MYRKRFNWPHGHHDKPRHQPNNDKVPWIPLAILEGNQPSQAPNTYWDPPTPCKPPNHLGWPWKDNEEESPHFVAMAASSTFAGQGICSYCLRYRIIMVIYCSGLPLGALNFGHSTNSCSVTLGRFCMIQTVIEDLATGKA